MSEKFNINEVCNIKICYKDRLEEERTAQATIKTASETEIVAFFNIEQRQFVKTPQDVEITLIEKNGIYSAQTTLLSAEYDEPTMYFRLQTPNSGEHKQLREFFRVNVKEGAVLSFKSDNSPVHITCKTCDISANGVCLELPQRINIPEIVLVTLLFNNKVIKIKSKFIRTTSYKNALRASFQFLAPQEHDVDFISKYCIQKQLEEKRKQ